MKTKEQLFQKIFSVLNCLKLDVDKLDDSCPWGGFFIITEMQAAQFAWQFFPEENFETLKTSGKLNPRILMVAPGKRLSWQYHCRRIEYWKCIDGELGVTTSFTNDETNIRTLRINDKIKLQQGERHRLIGLNDWGVIAEIWQHTDVSNPSDDNDFVRLQDDFGRQH